MKKLQRRIAYVLGVIFIISSLVACRGTNDNKDENVNNPTENQNTEYFNTEELSTENENTEETPVEESTQEDEVAKEEDSENPSESEDPSKSEIQSESEKPSETEKPSNTQKPVEPEADIPSNAPGWSKVPSFKDSNLTETEMAVKIVECIISSSMNDFQKVLEIHDWLIFNVDYDQTYSKYSAQNAFVDRSCVCQGYAEAFELLAEAAGLEATFVAGIATNSDGQTESHAWNQVKISGNWYNVDVTWDDPTYSGKSANDHSGNRYDYFLISKAQLEKDHRADSYYEGEKSCSSNYDRVIVLKTAANTGRYGDVAVVTNINEANSGIKTYMDKNKTFMNLWIYDTSVNESNSTVYIQNFVASLQYPISLSTFYPSNNGIIKCPIGIQTSSDWNAIPVVKNVDEFKDLLDKKGDAGVTTYSVRYEATNGQPVIEASKYGFRISYIPYNSGNSWLIEVEIN